MLSWIDFRKTLLGLRGARVHVLEVSRAAELEHTLQNAGFACYRLEGVRITDRSTFMREVARALAFPDYFGHNWDALDECLADLAERPARRIALLWTNADQLLDVDVQTFVDAVLAFDAAAAGLGGEIENGTEPIQLEIFVIGAGRAFEARDRR